LKRREIGKRKGKKNKAEKLRRPGRPSFLLALSPKRRLGDALKTLGMGFYVTRIMCKDPSISQGFVLNCITSEFIIRNSLQEEDGEEIS
jgi:hypothetical protein